MVLLKNVNCTINVDGIPLQEYTDPGDAAEREGPIPTAIVYIRSEEGKAFSINFSMVDDVDLFPEANALSWSVILDGNEIKPPWLCRAPRGSDSIHGNRYQDCYGNWVEQNFLFSKLDVTEDDRERKDNKDTSSLGEIALRICRYQTTGPVRLAGFWDNFHDAHGVKSLHEKQLKGRDITHSIGLAASKTLCEPPNMTPGHALDNRESPYAVIKFRYRTERALKGLGLIARTPLPSLSPEREVANANRGFEEAMSREELLAEVRHWRTTQHSKIKHEKHVSKRERSVPAGPSNSAPQKRKKSKVIDLTGDSD